MPIKYSMRKFFKGDPKSVAQVRDDMVNKLKEFKSNPTSQFKYIPETKADGQACLLISWTGDWKDTKHLALAAAKDPKQVLEGKFTANSKTKTYDFVLTEEGLKLLKTLLKDPYFSISVWNLFEGADPSIITFNKIPITRRVLTDTEWVVCSWNLTRILTTKGFYDKPPLETTEVVSGKEKFQVTPGGLGLPATIPFEVKIYGKVAETAVKDSAMWAFLRDDVSDIMRVHMDKLSKRLVDIETKEVPKDKSKNKEASGAALNNAFSTFIQEVEPAILQSITDNWLTHMEAHVEYRDYQIDAAISITKGAVGVILGGATAIVGGLTGVGAVLGFVGTLKGAAELAASIYTTFRSADGLRQELNQTLVATLLSYEKSPVWKENGKKALANVPVAGPLIQMVSARAGKGAKDFSALEKDVKTYNAKIAGLLVDAAKAGKAIDAVVDASNKALNELALPALLEKEKQNPKLKARNDRLRRKIGKETTEKLDRIGDLVKSFKDGHAQAVKYKTSLEEIEKLIKEDPSKLAKGIGAILVPLLNAPWGVDPQDWGGTVKNLAVAGIEIVTNIITEVADVGDKFDKANEWGQFVYATKDSLEGIIEDLQKL